MSRYTTELRLIIQNTSREEVESWFKDYELSDYLTEDEIFAKLELSRKCSYEGATKEAGAMVAEMRNKYGL